MKQKLATAIGITGSLIGITALLVAFFIDSIITFIAGTFVVLTSLLVYIFLNLWDKGFRFKARIPMAAALSVLYVGLAAYAVVVVVKDNKEAGNMDPGMNMGGDMMPGVDGEYDPGLDTGLLGGEEGGEYNGNLVDPTGDNQAEGSTDEDGSAQDPAEGETPDAEGEEASGESSASDETSGEVPAEGTVEETTEGAPAATTAAPDTNNSNNSNSGAVAVPLMQETAVAIPMK